MCIAKGTQYEIPMSIGQLIRIGEQNCDRKGHSVGCPMGSLESIHKASIGLPRGRPVKFHGPMWSMGLPFKVYVRNQVIHLVVLLINNSDHFIGLCTLSHMHSSPIIVSKIMGQPSITN